MKLIIEDDEGRKTVVPFVRDEISIGRNEGNTIRLTERNVSRRHARFVRGSGHVFIEDLGSYNGVRINGDSVQGRAEVQEGDLIEIGDYNLAVQAEAGELAAAAAAAPAREITSPSTQIPTTPSAPVPTTPAAPAPQAAAPAPAPAAAPPPPNTDHESTLPTARTPAATPDFPEAHTDAGYAADSTPRHESTAIIKVDFDALGKKAQERQLETGEQPSLVVLTTEYAGQTYVLDRSLVSIGRTDENDIQLDHRSMSRKHCRIFLDEEGTWKVADLGSANGVRLNGEEYGLIEVRPGDHIELGHLKMRFCGPGEDYVFVPEDADAVSGEVTTASTKVQRGGGGVPMPLVIGGAAAILLVAIGGIWMATSGGGDEDPGTDLGGTQPILDPRAGNTGTPIPTPTPDPGTKPDPGTAEVDPAVALNKAIQTASEAVERQDWPAAKTAYEKALELDASNAAASAGLKQVSLEDQAHRAFQAAKDLLAESRFIDAAQGFDSVPEGSLLSDDARTQAKIARRRAADRMRADAKAAMGIKDYEGAIAVAEDWLAFDPDSKEANKVIDRAQAAARKAARAATAPPPKRPPPKKDPVVKKDPPKPDPRVEEAKAAQAKGVQFLQKGKFELAAKQLERALKLDPKGQGLTHKMLGICYARLGNKDLAAKHYRLYIQKNPSAADAAKVRQILNKYDASKGGGG